MGEKIAVIGAGAWGTTIANLLAGNGHDVRLWVREENLIGVLQKERCNSKYLPDIRLNGNVSFFSEIDKCIEGCKIVFLAVPSGHIREICKKIAPFADDGIFIVNVAKGIECDGFKRMSEVISEEISFAETGTLSGPNYSIEVANRLSTASVIASKNNELMEHVRKIMTTNYFKVYPHPDIIGVEICGAVKNVPSIAAGIVSGIGAGDNALAGVITLGLSEMNKIGMHFGAKRSTVYGLAGLGDLVLSCTGKYSRNQFVGRQIANGKSMKEIISLLGGKIAEGIETSKAVYELSLKHDIDIPLSRAVYSVLHKGKPVKKAIEDLLDII